MTSQTLSNNPRQRYAKSGYHDYSAFLYVLKTLRSYRNYLQKIQDTLIGNLTDPEYYLASLKFELDNVEHSGSYIVNHSQLTNAFHERDLPSRVDHHLQRLKQCTEIHNKMDISKAMISSLDDAKRTIDSNRLAFSFAPRYDHATAAALRDFNDCMARVNKLLKCYTEGRIDGDCNEDIKPEVEYKIERADDDYRCLLAMTGGKPVLWMHLKMLHLCKVGLLKLARDWMPGWMAKVAGVGRDRDVLILKTHSLLQYETKDTSPKDVHFKDVDFDTATVHWSPGYHEEDQTYVIEYTANGVSSFSESVTDTQYRLEGLKAKTDYMITVIAKSHLRRDSRSKPKTLKTVDMEEADDEMLVIDAILGKAGGQVKSDVSNIGLHVESGAVQSKSEKAAIRVLLSRDPSHSVISSSDNQVIASNPIRLAYRDKAVVSPIVLTIPVSFRSDGYDPRVYRKRSGG
ncbi:uncharacterized protein [Ptychodera flava]|uniref:uncharacterized protein n=1 Tax=Ptychodera flava TaxID=63121 RepID=UPI00396A945A